MNKLHKCKCLESCFSFYFSILHQEVVNQIIKMNDEKLLKQQIIQSAKAVKNKVQNIKNRKLDIEMALDSVFKPVTDPLNKLAKTNVNADKEDKSYQEPCTSTIENSFNYSLPVSTSRKRKISDVSGTPRNTYHQQKLKFNDDDDNDDGDNDGMIDDDDVSDSISGSRNDNFFDTHSSTPNSKAVSSWSLSSEIFKDVPYGIRLVKGQPMVGSASISVTNNMYRIGGHSFDKTIGLTELLYKQKPDLSVVTENDKKIYKTILLTTNAHRRKYDCNQPINSNRGFKYLHIIKPLLNLNRSSSSERVPKGKGLPVFKRLVPKSDYVYWDDPNELVERLKLLIASRDAGNTGLDNEIISIIEELKECGAID